MIIKHHQYRYTARRGKLADRSGQTVTVRNCFATQIVVQFPDGHLAYVQARHLKEIKPA